MSPERMARLIHELEVHQIELEMQNDELRRTQAELEKTRDRYSDLYDFAPVGYFSVSAKGIIDKVNLTGAAMIGIERSALIGKPFTGFVLRDDQDIFYKLRQHLLEKPFEEQQLLDAIQAAVEKDRQSKQQQAEMVQIQKRAASLTPREYEVFKLVVSGRLNKQIADELAASEKTIKVHRARVMDKMKAQSLASLVRMAKKIGIFRVSD